MDLSKKVPASSGYSTLAPQDLDRSMGRSSAQRRLWVIPQFWRRPSAPPPPPPPSAPIEISGPPEPCVDHGPFACDEAGCPAESLVPHGAGMGVRGAPGGGRARHNARDHNHEPRGIPKTKLHGHVICTDLRDACHLTFNEVWRKVPLSTSGKHIWELCFKTCNSTSPICQMPDEQHTQNPLPMASAGQTPLPIAAATPLATPLAAPLATPPKDTWSSLLVKAPFAIGMAGGAGIPLALLVLVLRCTRGGRYDRRRATDAGGMRLKEARSRGSASAQRRSLSRQRATTMP